MRIVITYGRRPPYSPFGLHLVNAFRACGQEARLLCIRDRPCWGKWVKRLPSPWKERWGWDQVAYANQLVLKVAEQVRPDMILEIGGDLFTPETLRMIKHRWGSWLGVWLVEGPVSEPSVEVLAEYDHIVSTSRVVVDHLHQAGLRSSAYLPFATDPDTFHPPRLHNGHQQRQIGFIGAYSPKRERFLHQVSDLGLCLWGSEWDTTSTSEAIRKALCAPKGVFGLDLVRCYQSTGIVLNIQREHMMQPGPEGQQVGTGLGWRHFDVPACGNLVLSEGVLELSEAFAVGQEVETFSTPEELRDKARYLLGHEDQRRSMAQRAYARVLREHTYVHRVLHWLRGYERACV